MRYDQQIKLTVKHTGSIGSWIFVLAMLALVTLGALAANHQKPTPPAAHSLNDSKGRTR